MRFYIAFAAISSMFAVALGAFGAHALKAILSPERLAVWNTAVFYQLSHSIALLILVALSPYLQARWQALGLKFMLAAIVLFAGSLYALVLSGITQLGMITPIGGVCFLIAWVCVAIAAIKKPQSV